MKRSVEFQVDDVVLLRVSPTEGVVIFNGKLYPRYIGPFKKVALVGKLAYHLELCESMKGVYSVFYDSMPSKYFRGLE